MSELNPYAAPAARVADVLPAGAVELARPETRLWACLVDAILYTAIGAVGTATGLMLAQMPVAEPLGEHPTVGEFFAAAALAVIGALAAVTILFIYNCVLLYRSGQTVAKRMFQIRIVRPDGRRASFTRILLLRKVLQWVLQSIPLWDRNRVLAHRFALHRPRRPPLRARSRHKRRRGEGLEFHQLREYRGGDSLRQIDWKATSRQRKLVSREYQDERDQHVFFLVDCGRRMATKDGELSHFDMSLNAVLLLAYVALRQGDAVGVMTFSGKPRYLPAQKGMPTLTRLLEFLFDLSAITADLGLCARRLDSGAETGQTFAGRCRDQSAR
ncbi:MAG: DUF58 domain-containing protein [Chromatiales bacterium]